MTDQQWRDRIQVRPDAVTARASAERARRRALQRFDCISRSRAALRWPAAAIATALLGIVWLTTVNRTANAPPAVAQPTKLQFVLSDGTKVQWVFHDGFAL